MMVTVDDALALLHAGRAAGAARACRALLCGDPGNAAVLNLLGVALALGGTRGMAAVALARSAGVQPESAGILKNLGTILQDEERMEDAAACFRRLLLLQPDSAFANGQFGTLLYRRGDLDGAFPSLRRAVLLAPTEFQAQANLAIVLCAQGRLEEATRCLRAGAALDPGDAGCAASLGGALLYRGAPAAAEAAFDRALALDPGSRKAAEGRERSRRYRRAMAGAGRVDLPEGVVVRGHVAGTSGYGHMTERFIRTLLNRGVRIDLIGLFGAEARLAEDLAADPRPRVALNFLTPAELEPLPGLPAALFSMFEGPRIPPAWRRLSERADLVIVPTESSKAAWASQGYPEERLRICPLGTDPVADSDPGSAAPETLRLLDSAGVPVLDYRCRFLNVSDFIPRKNIDGLLRVWMRSTTAADDAVLILKLGKGSRNTRAAIDALIRRTEEHVGRRLEEAAPVVIIDRLLDEAEMVALFRTATHYWSLSHGEGWDLLMSRAGAMGLRLIAPRHSAYVDYLDDTVAHMIPATVGPACEPYSRRPWEPFFGLDWWEPDEGAAAEIIGRIIHGRDRTTADARAHLLGRFTWERATDRLLSILRELAPS